MCSVLNMKHNTTRPVAVNAGPHTPRRGFADNGVRANGNTKHSRTTKKEHDMRINRRISTGAIGAAPYAWIVLVNGAVTEIDWIQP